MPTTFQLTARLDHPQIATAYEGCYSYDEPALGIIAEPLVPSTAAVIQHAFGTPHPRVRVSGGTGGVQPEASWGVINQAQPSPDGFGLWPQQLDGIDAPFPLIRMPLELFPEHSNNMDQRVAQIHWCNE